jgi:hypothetical protein
MNSATTGQPSAVGVSVGAACQLFQRDFERRTRGRENRIDLWPPPDSIAFRNFRASVFGPDSAINLAKKGLSAQGGIALWVLVEPDQFVVHAGFHEFPVARDSI